MSKVMPLVSVARSPKRKSTKTLSRPQKIQSQTPLEVMMQIMNERMQAKEYELALEVAYKAAPYMHARLSEAKLDMFGKKTIEEMSDEELETFIGASKNNSD